MTDSNPFQPPTAPVADVVDPSELQLASRWARLGAALIDGLVISIIVFPIIFALGMFNFAEKHHQTIGDSIIISLISFSIFTAIQGYFLAKGGQTIGKKALGVRIVNLDGELPPFGRLLGLRYGVMYLINLIPILGGVVALVDILMIFRSDKRCLHDLIAGTRVVRLSPA